MKLCTFLSWGCSGIIGHKEVVGNGVVFVNFVWCKLCAKNKNCVLQHPLRSEDEDVLYIKCFMSR